LPIGCGKFVGETPIKAKKAKIEHVAIKRYSAFWQQEVLGRPANKGKKGKPDSPLRHKITKKFHTL
jgi:hypothetical protein